MEPLILRVLKTSEVESKEEELLSFLDHRPDGLEVVLTGRNPSAALRERSDYDSEIRKEKHPFDRGITGRDGIER